MDNKDKTSEIVLDELQSSVEVNINNSNQNSPTPAEQNDADNGERKRKRISFDDRVMVIGTAGDADEINEDEEDINEDDLSDDDNSDDSNDSEYSELSGLSDLSGQEWKPINKPMMNCWVQKQIQAGANPRDLLSQILPNCAGVHIAPHLNEVTLWRIVASIMSEPPRRRKLTGVNTIQDVVELLKVSKNIIVLTGAGVSVSCGIPDFRSSDGIYSRLAKDFPDLPDPQAMFDICYFSKDPRPFYKFAREIYPGQFSPSPCHRFIKLLEKKNKLLRNYTQNIDTLEQVAGIQNVIECHGSFSTASCTNCKFKTTAEAIREDIFAQRIPVCPKCQPNGLQLDKNADGSPSFDTDKSKFKEIVEKGIMKPDIVFFGEGLPEEFHNVMAKDKDKCDLLIVIGSSLKVRPVALIPSSIPAHVPQILINREQLKHLEFDVELLGDSDVVINLLCRMLGDDWSEVCWDSNLLTESNQLKPKIHEKEKIITTLDIDTQSIRSSESAEINASSVTYSDSGFESSTSSFQPPAPHLPITQNIQQSHNNKRNFGEFNQKMSLNNQEQEAAVATIKKLKHGMLELNDTCHSPRDNEFNAEIDDTDSYPNHFSYASQPNNLRHLSVDSSKDSGICDSFNTVPSFTSVETQLDTGVSTSEENEQQQNPSTIIDNTAATPSTSADSTNRGSGWHRQTVKNRGSAANRLTENSYYHHKSSCSYVFPGAQVSWSSDSEDDFVDRTSPLFGNMIDYEDDDDDDLDFITSAPTPNTEEKINIIEPSEKTSLLDEQSNTSIGNIISQLDKQDISLSKSNMDDDESPPVKRRRDFEINSQIIEE